MELRLDAAINKTGNLAMDVEIYCMRKKFDSLMGKSHNEQVVSMVAESSTQYGAEVFEAYEKEKNTSDTLPNERVSA